MKGDFTRSTFRPGKHYGGVLMQQGRVQLDADWNEEVDIQRRNLRLVARDLIGACGGPTEHAGFEIKVIGSGRQITVGAGRYYVGGQLAENEELCVLEQQPDLPSAPEALRAAESRAGAHLAYLDVWEREVTCLDDATLREVALGGPDTSVRVKVVWQVRLHGVDGAAVDCPKRATGGGETGGFLNVTTEQSGYRGPENHLYRVEIHRSGGVGEATFKWSRDNGSVAAPIEKIEGNSLTFGDASVREGRAFASSQWVEVSDDTRELDGRSGDLHRIVALDDAQRTMTLTEAPRSLVSGANGVDLSRHPKVRRWDHVGGDEWGERTGSDPRPLENGIEMHFSAGEYRTGDYWTFPARTAHGRVEWPGGDSPEAQPPRRIVHHCCPLAELAFDANRHVWHVREDRRSLFATLAAPR